ncbi:RNA 2'-phosphotransferase [Frigoribacterium sp. PhB24]|uniref:RNA 2'-phosphotransferase n=1 Tax=Frigoribacterium sp. PhB24 TaxID=2485204 RepID=UPI000F4A473A|nr:RNA 2'-phosphotransferase [Frigoribacterium sp. PhB24]ROS52641.1 RNA:NAD 2'-phosphotransferase (TPT1/KptA family) [Frigoribacterium sp. PhB24]
MKPNPGQVAAFYAVRPETAFTDLALQAQANFEAVCRTAKVVGIRIDEQLENWVDLHGLEVVRLWLSDDASPAAITDSWFQLRSTDLPAFAALIVEAKLSTAGAEIGSYLRSSGSSYGAEIVEARWLTARALRDHAGTIPFHEPVILVRAAELTLAAYETLWPHTQTAPAQRTPIRLGREIGRQVVTAARFSTPDVDRLRSALEHLEASASHDDRDYRSAALRIEASLEIYHATGEVETLREAARYTQARFVPSNEWPSWHLNTAEIWLNLADHASDSARKQFLARARDSLRTVELQSLELAHEIRCLMLIALHDFILEHPHKELPLRNVRLPFTLRTSRALPPTIEYASDALMEILRKSAERGQYQYREYLAELESRIARSSSKTKAIELLQDAVRLREPIGTKRALGGVRDKLAQAQDLLLLAEMTQHAGHRAAGIDILLRQHHLNPTSSEPLVLLANNIETSGRYNGATLRGNPALVAAIRSGDETAVFAQAAKNAINNPALRMSGLGGRGKAYTVDDFSGITGQTFVFKRTSPEALLRDSKRAKNLSGRLADLGVSPHFGVIEHISSLVVGNENEAGDLISVRRYARGRTLRQALGEPGSEPIELLRQTSRFLGLIHGWEHAEIRSGPTARRVIKDRELGRWLRKLAGNDKGSLFNEWWGIIEEMPDFPRRDAHTLNWLVNDDQRVLAADLESIGLRPLTYELAQLVDDAPVIDPADWETRDQILGIYLNSLGLDTQEVHFEAYRASTAARSVGLLTDARSTSATRDHAYRLLAGLAGSETSKPLGAWANKILSAWAVKTGLSDPTRLKSIQPNDRVRISKAMSYHLRHDTSAKTAVGGWMFAEDLADALKAHGHRGVTPEQLLVVAGALGEPRFELDGQEIRASYGHSVNRRSDYERPTPPEWLFHATAIGNLPSIFEARAGLRSMDRQFVHMTTDPDRALHSAKRHSSNVVLLRVAGAKIPDVVKAAEDTWLIELVPAADLEVVTIPHLVRQGLEFV